MNQQNGQALITLLFFVIMGITITTAAVIVVLTNSIASSRFEQGTESYYIAESGAENALLQLDRNPNYSGETLTIANGTDTISVTAGNPVIIISTGQIGSYIRKIQVQAVYTNSSLSVLSWKEIN